MSGCDRSKRNRRIRVIINQMVTPLQPGDQIKTEEVLNDLQALDGRWGLNGHQIGNMMREREDLKHVANNTWEKLPA